MKTVTSKKVKVFNLLFYFYQNIVHMEWVLCNFCSNFNDFTILEKYAVFIE